MRIIRASEIGTYLFCQRAWWYRQNGVPSANVVEMAQGTQIHQKHSRAVFAAGCTRSLAYGLLLVALLLLVIGFANWLV